MGHEIDRPRIAGVGERPTTPKPEPLRSTIERSFEGRKPTSEKPASQPSSQQPVAKEK